MWTQVCTDIIRKSIPVIVETHGQQHFQLLKVAAIPV